MQHSRNVGGIFNHPVDTRNPSLANYLSKIERPIDLGTIRGRLQKGEFETVAKISQDMLRVFDNAMAYNPEEYHLHQLARIMRTELENELKIMDEKLTRETRRKHNHGSTCKLCQGEVCNFAGKNV